MIQMFFVVFVIVFAEGGFAHDGRKRPAHELSVSQPAFALLQIGFQHVGH